jgi:hypothetical protein
LVIRRERADGSLEDAGCGAVMVDPGSIAHPDVRSGGRAPAIGGTSLPEAASGDSIRGDFERRCRGWRVGDHRRGVRVHPEHRGCRTQPAVVRPGSGPAHPDAPGADAEAELARFRTAVPSFAGWSWIVSV